MELTARIGKELLSQNNKLQTTVSTLETDLKKANDKITQLTHEIHKKAELVQILTNDVDDSCAESGLPGRLNLDVMQKKICKWKKNFLKNPSQKKVRKLLLKKKVLHH